MSKFVKGDPRINRGGRPKGKGVGIKAALRELGSELVEYNGVMMSRHKAILLNIIEGAIGGDAQDKQLYLNYLYGKPSQHVEIDASVNYPIQSPERDAALHEMFGGSDNGEEDEDL